MDAFQPHPPLWTSQAVRAFAFCCPSCGTTAAGAKAVWINRRAPVYGEDRRRKWQEFYWCECGTVWWAWSNDRPPSELGNREFPFEDFPNFL
ncbi:MAG TPA: hypothetical protein DCQ32_05580 [Cyanobacteria bacterium UBA8156]|jgi:hypothetical protein|nr:hypothetical protein [Cyanobacteria bacterium UBA8156]